MRITYRKHYHDHSEGHLFLDKEGACTIKLTGAAAMSQEELDEWGQIIAKSVTKAFHPEVSIK